MGGEDGGDVDVPLSAEWNREARLPLVEVGDDGGPQLAGDVLNACEHQKLESR